MMVAEVHSIHCAHLVAGDRNAAGWGAFGRHDHNSLLKKLFHPDYIQIAGPHAGRETGGVQSRRRES